MKQLKLVLKLLLINKRLYIIYQKRNIVKYFKYCQKHNDKNDKVLNVNNALDEAK